MAWDGGPFWFSLGRNVNDLRFSRLVGVYSNSLSHLFFDPVTMNTSTRIWILVFSRVVAHTLTMIGFFRH